MKHWQCMQWKTRKIALTMCNEVKLVQARDGTYCNNLLCNLWDEVKLVQTRDGTYCNIHLLCSLWRWSWTNEGWNTVHYFLASSFTCFMQLMHPDYIHMWVQRWTVLSAEVWQALTSLVAFILARCMITLYSTFSTATAHITIFHRIGLWINCY